MIAHTLSILPEVRVQSLTMAEYFKRFFLTDHMCCLKHNSGPMGQPDLRQKNKTKNTNPMCFKQSPDVGELRDIEAKGPFIKVSNPEKKTIAREPVSTQSQPA